jgi:signal peptidase I
LWGCALTLSFAEVWDGALACGALASALGLALTAFTLLSGKLVVITVRGVSMQPTYDDGDRVLVRRDVAPEPGQVVVVEHLQAGAIGESCPLAPGAAGTISSRQWLIKRVAAAPGDPVPRGQFPALSNVPEARVPSGSLVLLGDNQQVSYDSRQLGYFPVERVLGRVTRRLSRREGI